MSLRDEFAIGVFVIKEIPEIKYESSDGKGRVFISYQRNSLDFVLQLSQFFEANGVKTWYAPRNIKISGKWPEKLCEAISNCKALLLLYTDKADKSKHVLREVYLADDMNKPIIWLCLDDSQPSKTLKYYLSLIQAMNYTTFSRDEAEEVLLKILKSDPVDVELLKESSQQSRQETIGIDSTKWSKGIFAFDNQDDAGECIARVYFEMARKNPSKMVLLPTGRSAKIIFYSMIRIAHEYPECPFGVAPIMNDTETFGVNSKHITSRVKVIDDFLISPLKEMNKAPNEEQLKYFMGISDVEDSDVVASQMLKKYPPSVYGISISPYCEIIGYDLGKNAETIVNDGPRLIEVNDETKEYIDSKQKTNSIYTIGLGTALKSELMMIVALDNDKSSAIARLFSGDIDQ